MELLTDRGLPLRGHSPNLTQPNLTFFPASFVLVSPGLPPPLRVPPGQGLATGAQIHEGDKRVPEEDLSQMEGESY